MTSYAVDGEEKKQSIHQQLAFIIYKVLYSPENYTLLFFLYDHIVARFSSFFIYIRLWHLSPLKHISLYTVINGRKITAK